MVLHALVQTDIGVAVLVIQRPGAELVYVALVVPQDLFHGFSVPGAGGFDHRPGKSACPATVFFFSAAGQIIYFRDIIREVFEGFIKICKKWVAIKATRPIKMEFSKLLLHRLYFWSFLRQAHHYVVP